MTICHIKEDRRQKYLEWLYARSNRTNGLYTGLFQQRIAELVHKDMDETLGPLGDWQ
jgi:hypothetical protein